MSAEQALGGLSIVRSLGRCNSSWIATAIVPDSDFDGWGNVAELRLGASPNGSSTPEHWEIPTTPLRGPDPCRDLIDNDRDGLVDDADPDCTPV
jgi:hypothetical protein